MAIIDKELVVKGVLIDEGLRRNAGVPHQESNGN